MTIPNFPNFWMLEGPTGPVGNLSLISITETQLGYMIQCLDQMKTTQAASIAVKQATFDAFNKAMAEEVVGTTWATGGCDSWYIDKTGTPNLYPWHPSKFYKEMEQVDFSEYQFSQQVTSEV